MHVPALRAPKNSSESSDNYNLDYSTEEEVKKKDAMDDKPPEPIFEENFVALQPWDLEKLNVFPHKHRDNEPPVRLLNQAEEQYLITARDQIH